MRLYFGAQGSSPTDTFPSCQAQWGALWVEVPRHEYVGTMVIWWSLGKSGVCLGVMETASLRHPLRMDDTAGWMLPSALTAAPRAMPVPVLMGRLV